MMISGRENIKRIIGEAKKKHKRVLIKKGVFDIIHPGHIYAIREFKKLADIVIIFIQSDYLTGKEKGNKRPINNQKQRAEVVDGINGVDYVYLDKSKSREECLSLLEYLKPHIIAIVKTTKGETETYARPYWILKEFPDRKKGTFSTSRVINKITKKYK